MCVSGMISMVYECVCQVWFSWCMNVCVRHDVNAVMVYECMCVRGVTVATSVSMSVPGVIFTVYELCSGVVFTVCKNVCQA